MFSEITFFLIKDLNFQSLTVVWRNDKVRMPEPRPSIKTEALQVGNQNYYICSTNVCWLSCKRKPTALIKTFASSVPIQQQGSQQDFDSSSERMSSDFVTIKQ